jgi:hypothetical protein
MHTFDFGVHDDNVRRHLNKAAAAMSDHRFERSRGAIQLTGALK